MRLNRNVSCLCGSGSKLKHCCGRYSKSTSRPVNIGVVENFVSPELCQKILAYSKGAQANPMSQLAVSEENRFSETRVGEEILIDGMDKEIIALITRAYQEEVSSFYSADIEWVERPQILRYGMGGKYKPHADAYVWRPQKKQWVKVIDRDYSILIYLDEQFEGGALYFNLLDYLIKPKAGMLVFFPSDQVHMHEAQEVITGKRHAIVTWGAVKGVSRIGSNIPENTILMDK